MKKKLVICMLIITILVLCGCGDNKSGNVVEQANVTGIETPYCTVYVPADFDNKVENSVKSETPYVIAFKAAEGEDLFEISFDGEGNVLGTLMLDDKNVVVRVESSELDEESDKYSEYSSYQEEGINTILQHLTADYEFRVGEVVESEHIETFDIETSVATLKYPVKWKEDVDVVAEENVVKFSCDDIALFDLYFGTDEGYLLGTYAGKSVSIADYALSEEDFDEDEYLKLSGMKEDVNVIIQNLSEDKKFELAE